MSIRRFVLTQLRETETGDFVDTPVQFVWTADSRTGMQGAWDFGKQVRSNRYDYPGTTEPTEQILGVNHKTFSIAGEFDDHYAGPGYADATRRALEALVDKAPMVRYEHDGISITGLLKEVDFHVVRSDFIGYRITISPHFRVRGEARSAVTVPQLQGPTDFSDVLHNQLAAIQDLHASAPKVAVAGTLMADIKTAIDDVSDKLDTVDAIIANRTVDVQAAAAAPVNAVTRLAQSFAATRNSALALRTVAGGVRTDLNLTFQTAVNTLAADAWIRGIRANTHDMMLQGALAAREMRRRESPDLLALYRPQAGESLYEVSQRFYSTPHRWRDIAKRNGLATFTLQGTETLSIPRVELR